MTTLDFLTWQIRGAIVISAGYALLRIACSRLGVESSRVHFFAVTMILLAAGCPWSWQVRLPWLPPRATESPTTSDVAKIPVLPLEKDGTSIDLESLATMAGDYSEPQTSPLPSRPFSIQPSSLHRLAARWPKGSLRAGFRWLWVVFVGGVCLLGIGRYVSVVLQVRRNQPANDEWVREWELLCRAHSLPRGIPLLTTHCLGPMLGLLPRGFCLLVPRNYWGELERTQRQMILRHELAHYLRGDIFASCFLRFLAFPFAYHPLAWRLIGLCEESSEWACDRVAIGTSDGVSYARALEQLLNNNLPETSLALGRCAQSHPLVSRIRRILNPTHSQESPMKTLSLGATMLFVALVSLVQIRLIAQDDRAATAARVQQQMKELEGRLSDLKQSAETAKDDAKQLEGRVRAHIEKIKALAADPTKLSEEIRRRGELLKSDDEAKQLEALDGIEKLGDEGLLLCAYGGKSIESEAVRKKVATIACALGEEGLPVLAIALDAFNANQRLFTVNELSKHRDKIDRFIFARLAADENEEVRTAAIKAGLEKAEPFLFLALTLQGSEAASKSVLNSLSALSADDQQLILFAAAMAGSADALSEVVRKAAALKERGDPIIAAAFQRKTAESRAEIVRLLRKSKEPVAQLLVQHALQDEDATLRAAAEKANQDP